MADDTTTPPAGNSGPAANTNADGKTVQERAGEFLNEAGEAIEEAFDATVDAAKKHPIAAAAIATGAAAAVAGAVFGAAKLFGGDEEEGDAPAAKK